MDSLSITLGVISVLSTIVKVKLWFEASEAARIQREAQRVALVGNYGPIIGWAVSFFLGNTASQYFRIQTSVLKGKDEDAVQFREAVTNECNMTAIAVSHFLLASDVPRSVPT